MNRIFLPACVAITLFVALASIETIRSEDPFDLTSFVLDLFETAVLALAIFLTAFVSLETREMRRERADLLNDLARARAEGDEWRNAARAHIDGLSHAIRKQFDEWQLSEGEADVAVLMLKGLSHKEIARLRASTEATVRQQSVAIYRKSGLSSRAELSAYFLEDLLAPKVEVAMNPPSTPFRLVNPKD